MGVTSRVVVAPIKESTNRNASKVRAIVNRVTSKSSASSKTRESKRGLSEDPTPIKK